MARLHYREISPPSAVSHALDCLWSVRVTSEGGGNPSHWVLPDGSYSLAIGVRGPWYIHLRKPSLLPFRAPCQPGQEIVGLRFRPGVMPHSVLRTIQRSIRPGQTAEEVLFAMQHFVRRHVPDPDPRIDRMISLLRAADGRIALSSVAETVELSPRHLERLSRQTIGLSPKGFARVTRLQAVIRRVIATPEVRLADCAAEFGFADQTHMTREFSALGHLTPAAYLRMIRDVGFLLESRPEECVKSPS